MPLYDLGVQRMQPRLRGVQAMNSPRPTRCEKCGKKKVRRVLLEPSATYDGCSPMHPRGPRGTASAERAPDRVRPQEETRPGQEGPADIVLGRRLPNYWRKEVQGVACLPHSRRACEP